MKTINKVILRILSLVALISFNACTDDDSKFEFVAQTPIEEITFTNTFQESYILTSQTSSNLAERFVWVTPDYGFETIVGYDLQGSTTESFETFTLINSTTEDNEIAVTVGQMLSLATQAGLDNDPDTAAPDTGQIYFRLKASLGTQDSSEAFSSVQSLTVVLPEASSGGGSGISLSSWGIVGNGYNDWGAFADAPFYTTNTNGVLVSYVTLVDGEIKFRENNNWDSNLGDNDANGSLEPGGANILVTAGNYKITLNLNDNTYTMEDFSWGIVGSAYNDWGATPDAKFYYDYTTDNFKVSLRLQTGEFKVRFNNAWGGDLGDSDNDGILDTNPDNNIPVTEGHYTITFNPNDNSYSIVEDEVWGIVGSGYNNWGESPDFSLTKLGESLYVGDIATIIDGELKFRKNNNWGGDLGDANNDGILDADPDNNIAVTAGLYRIVYDSSSGAYAFNKVQ